MSSMRCIYDGMLKILIKWEIIFLYCYLKKIFEKSSMEMKLSVEKTS